MADNEDNKNTQEAGEAPSVPPACATCKKTPPQVKLKNCAKCSVTLYCSRECQKTDWKVHKKICAKQASAVPPTTSTSTPQQTKSGSTLPSPPKGLDAPITKPFTRLENNTWLHDRSEKDVYRLLIDAYRLRMDDNHVFEEAVDKDSIYNGAANGLCGFQRFLKLAASRHGLLPPWWAPSKQQECERLSMDHQQSNWHDLACKIKKSDVIEHYGDSQFPMQLRMCAETVYGRGIGGMSGATMRKQMVRMESGSQADHFRMMSLDTTGLRP